jgi:beta-glucosidase-like glycosyl hydrolase
MRTEAQKKMDEVLNLTEHVWLFDEAKGKIVVKQVREFEPEKVEKQVEAYAEQIAGMEKEILENEAKLKEIGEIESDRKVREFLALMAKAGKLEQKRKIEEQLLKAKDQLQFHKDTFADQERLIGEWKAWNESKKEAK